MTKMNRLFKKKPEESSKYSQRDIFLGIPTSIAVGPLGFRAELDVDPKGESSRSYRDVEADCPDSTVATDEKSNKSPRIVFQAKNHEDQELPAQETLTPAVVGDAGRASGLPGEHF